MTNQEGGSRAAHLLFRLAFLRCFHLGVGNWVFAGRMNGIHQHQIFGWQKLPNIIMDAVIPVVITQVRGTAHHAISDCKAGLMNEILGVRLKRLVFRCTVRYCLSFSLRCSVSRSRHVLADILQMI